MDKPNTIYDLAIVGGGMVGASLARALAGKGMRIAVIEAHPFRATAHASYDDRAIALSHGSRLILEAIGIWPALGPAAAPIRHIHISDRGRFGFARLDHAELNVPALGYVALAQSMGEALLRGLEALPGIDLLCPATLDDFAVHPGHVELHLHEDGQPRTITARLLVAADGAHSRVRTALNIQTREWRYGQTAIIANLTPEAPKSGWAYERFTETGPMAMLPLPEGRYGLVWTVPEAEAPALLDLEEAAFLARVQARFGHRLGRLLEAGRRSGYPLRLLQAKEGAARRVVLVGNAAHALHPVTGQGFNLGVRDAAVLAEVVLDAHRAGRDIGELEILDRYTAWRRTDQAVLPLVTDGLIRLFTNPLPPVRCARDLGLLAFDRLPPLKAAVARGFMGLGGRLPRLGRGLPLE